MNWSGWMTAVPKEQEAMQRRYKAEIKRESDEALATGYRMMNAALAGKLPSAIRSPGAALGPPREGQS